MQTPNIKTSEKVIPMIYAYTTPGVTYHDGYIKIGYTEGNVDKRIHDQNHTPGIFAKKEWQGTAIFDDGSGDSFTDKPLHAYMRNLGVKQPQDLGNTYFDPKDRNEWFYISASESRKMFNDFRGNRGILSSIRMVVPYTLRHEQAEAIRMMLDYKTDNPNGEFLMNCKPRFGKTLTVYDFCKQAGAQTVLIVTNRPAIANSWYDDYVQFLGVESGYRFVSEVDALRNRPGVLSRKQYTELIETDPSGSVNCIEFVSLQDMKGSIYFSPYGIDKLGEVAKMNWDVLVVDEAHEGVDTYKTDIAFDHIHRNFTIHLSGTPFKALANNKFGKDAIYNWTYADEQDAKEKWDDSRGENPYSILPTLNLFTYQMSEIIKEELKQGIEIQGETEEYAFDLNEFFRTANGKFVYEASVDRFLDALTLQKKFPFSTSELRNELKHTFWILERVESARALAKKLNDHPVFKDYKVVLAAGDGKIDDTDQNQKSFDAVREAIAHNDKTITLSVGQLTVGVTIPEWSGVLILSNIKSPALYMQAAFRAQNPCLYQKGLDHYRKENAYVFDFDPARTLTIYEEFANDLIPATAAGKGDLAKRQENIRQLLNFFPVIGEDESGELVPLDPEQVLSIPRKIRSMEVVRRGFMSNFLFQNISQIFGAPKEVLDIINQMQSYSEPPAVKLPEEVKEDLQLDDEGNVSLSDEYVDQKTSEIFGNKIFDTSSVQDVVKTTREEMPDDDTAQNKAISEAVKEIVHDTVKNEIIENVKEQYGASMRASDAKRMENLINADADRAIDKEITNIAIEQNVVEQERSDAMQKRHETGRTTEEINKEFDQKQKEIKDSLGERLQNAIKNVIENSKKDVTKTVETTIKQREKNEIEDGIRDHLRGFSRTIPSFLMAYGDNTVTLATFDTVIPDKVFKDVTSITLDDFRLLRDGGVRKDKETGEDVIVPGKFFDEVVFDDSVQEFLNLKKKLADYFDEKSIEDIFDYIPPQKTNQIYTPKTIVKMMVDKLEEENPGCFDQPDKTFIDLYMKSGLYPAEIVKRLYQSPKMKELFPDGKERLQHIFEKQVYGLAPTEIIYKIAISYILGFTDEIEIKNHNFRQVDALPYAKDGKLDELLENLYGNNDSSPVNPKQEMVASPKPEMKEITPVLDESGAVMLDEDGASLYFNDDIDVFLDYVRAKGIEIKDNRPNNGCVWVKAVPEINELIKKLKFGYKRFRYSASSKALGGEPGWYC